MIHYRTFRNSDPPGVIEVWNAAFSGRGAVHLHGSSWTEYFLFSKPYFDPQSLIVAEADGQIVGFAWTGFGPNDSERAVDTGKGVVCLLGVAPSHRRQGVGSELLRRAETYLRSRGSNELLAGPLYPLNPYSFGLYGGSNSPGFLESDPLARLFFAHHGYAAESQCVVLQRSLQKALNIGDNRFIVHRLRYEIRTNPFRGASWWQECVLGPVELYECRLLDKLTGRSAARAFMWEMQTYAPCWNEHAVGITDLVVPTEMRRLGLAKYLMAQLLHYMHDQFFSIAEMQVGADNTAALNLLRGLGFEQVDVGYVYRKSSQ